MTRSGMIHAFRSVEKEIIVSVNILQCLAEAKAIAETRDHLKKCQLSPLRNITAWLACQRVLEIVLNIGMQVFPLLCLKIECQVKTKICSLLRLIPAAKIRKHFEYTLTNQANSIVDLLGWHVDKVGKF